MGKSHPISWKPYTKYNTLSPLSVHYSLYIQNNTTIVANFVAVVVVIVVVQLYLLDYWNENTKKRAQSLKIFLFYRLVISKKLEQKIQLQFIVKVKDHLSPIYVG